MKLAILYSLATLLFISGCSHQAAILNFGTKASLGINPQTFTASISYTDGLNLIDLARENSGWELEVDPTIGISFDKENGKLTGVRKIRRFIGPQITGYLTKLAENDPEFAREYIKAVRAYWEAVGSKSNRSCNDEQAR